MPAHTIAVLNLNETRRDPRVLRIGRSLAGAGHRIVVFEMQGAGDPAHERIDAIEICRVPVPTRYATEDMAEFRSVCRPAFEIIANCDPRVAGDRRGLAWYCRPDLARRAMRHHFGRFGGAGFDRDRESRDIPSIRSILLINLAIYKAALSYRPTLVHCNDLDTLLAGYMFKKNHHLPLVYDAHEIYPEQLSRDMRSDTWYNFYTSLEKRLILAADARITVCDSLAGYFSDKYGAGGFKTILNVPSLAFLPPPEILSRRRERSRLLYHGSYFAYRGLEEIIRAARRIEDADIVFRGIGAHETALRELCRAEGVEERITFAPPVSVGEMIPAASDCDIGLSPFVPVCKNTEYALPNKFFEYMMAGLGCVSADLVEMRRLTQQLAVGVTFPSLDPADIADCLNELVAQPERIEAYRFNAYEAARTRFNWEHEEQEFLAYYGRFAG